MNVVDDMVYYCVLSTWGRVVGAGRCKEEEKSGPLSKSLFN